MGCEMNHKNLQSRLTRLEAQSQAKPPSMDRAIDPADAERIYRELMDGLDEEPPVKLPNDPFEASRWYCHIVSAHTAEEQQRRVNELARRNNHVSP